MNFPHEQLIDLLREVNRDLGRYVKEILLAHDVPPAAMSIIREIRSEPGITISELARRTGIAKSHISNLVRDLEGRGWVEKRPDDNDQRLLRLYICPGISGRLAEIRRDIRSQIGLLVADISEERAQDLAAGLEEIKRALANQTRRNCE